MRAAWYEQQGPAREVLMISEMADPTPGPGELRIRIVASGIDPGDIKRRQNAFGNGMPYPRVIPHSDGAGQFDQVGEGVPVDWVGRRVWCYGADRSLRDEQGTRRCYSERNVFTGSSRTARYPDTRLAINATTASVPPTAASVIGSDALTPNTSVLITL